MKERPILFSSPMVRAINEGRKTQTRRVMKPQITEETCFAGFEGMGYLPVRRDETPILCPYGVPGDRLWARETWYCDHCFGPCYANPPIGSPEEWRGEVSALSPHGDLMYYRADGEIDDLMPERDGPVTWRPSIFMPRWASRILLEVTDVRVQRVQEISGDDVLAEGCRLAWGNRQTLGTDEERARKDLYSQLWDSINAKRGLGWDVNPWVWAITFRRIDAAAT
jgi:hypothetical protein